MLRRILTQYPHAEFVFQFAPDGILSFYGEFLPDIKGIAAEMCWCVIDCDTSVQSRMVKFRRMGFEGF